MIRAFAGALLAAATAAHAQHTLTLLDLPGIVRGPQRLDDTGRIVGVVDIDGIDHPYVREPDGSITILPTPAGFLHAAATATTPDGAVLGHASPDEPWLEGVGVVWRAGAIDRVLPRPLADAGLDAPLIISDGAVLGSTSRGGGAIVRWTPEGTELLGADLHAAALSAANARGEAAGSASPARGSPRHALYADPDGRITLGPYPHGSEYEQVTAITERGIIVVHGLVLHGDFRVYSYLWNPATGRVDADGFENAILHDLNERELGIGWWPLRGIGDHCLWSRRTGPIPLEQLLPAGSTDDFLVASVAGINNRGEVLLYMNRRGQLGEILQIPALLTLCPADFNLDATADTSDLLDFLAAFREANPYANLHEPATTDVDVHDLLAFLAAFRSGCQ